MFYRKFHISYFILPVSYFLPNPRPSWSVCRSDISTGEHPGKSTTSLLPINDLNPTLVSQLMEPLLCIDNNFEEEKMGIETSNNRMPSKEVIKIDDLLIEIKNVADAIKERKPVDVKMQPIFIFAQVENKFRKVQKIVVRHF